MSIVRALAAATALVLLPLAAHAGEPAKAPAAAAKTTDVIFETSSGNFTIRVNAEKAPVSAENFLKYVDEGFYNGLVFHRVINGFMVQGGGFTPDMRQKQPTRGAIKNEADNGLKNLLGTVAMARTSEVNSATSQFFVNVVDNPRLDFTSADARGYGYAVFGEVIAGMDTINKIKAVQTCPGNAPQCATMQLPPGMRDVPAQPVVITKAYRKK